MSLIVSAGRTLAALNAMVKLGIPFCSLCHTVRDLVECTRCREVVCKPCAPVNQLSGSVCNEWRKLP